MQRLLIPFAEPRGAARAVEAMLREPRNDALVVHLVAVVEPLRPGKVAIFLSAGRAEALVRDAARRWLAPLEARLSAAGVAFHVSEVLGRRGAEEKESKNSADEPWLDGHDGLDRRPSRNLEEDPTWNCDRHVGPDTQALGPERRHRVENGNRRGDEDDPKALVPSARRDEPSERQRDGIRDCGERPCGGQAQPSRRQRPFGLVDAIDLEVVDLVDGVRRRIQHRRHRQANHRIEK